MHQRKIISLINANNIQTELQMTHNINLEIFAEEQIAIIGPNGSGKSLLINMILGTRPLTGNIYYDFGTNSSPRISDNIRLITFKDVYGNSYTPTYYQQRWNQGDSESYPLISEILDTTPKYSNENLYKALHIYELYNKRIIELSSGELRRFQIAQALKNTPQILILDNPLIGLDKASRLMITQILESLQHEMQLIIVTTRYEDIPKFVTHVVEVNNKTTYPKIAYSDYIKTYKKPTPQSKVPIVFPRSYHDINTQQINDNIIALKDVSIKYGQKTILNHINWEVKKGEHWALSGVNGAGKSTLLSLINADNPQAYSCDITLFGKKRGTGESIWDIKKRIGYLSPEMFRSFNKNLTAKEIIANSLLNAKGFFKKPSPKQLEESLIWMQILNIAHLAERKYPTLSSGEQRLVLLARAFVKSPELLILDEPFHGLDNNNISRLKHIINQYCKQNDCSLILVSHYTEDYPSCIDHEMHLQKQA